VPEAAVRPQEGRGEAPGWTGWPRSPWQPARLRYTVVEPHRRLVYLHATDFIPGVAPYDVEHTIDLYPADGEVKLLLTIDRMHDDTWTQRAVQGWEMELGKLERVLAGRGAEARP